MSDDGNRKFYFLAAGAIAIASIFGYYYYNSRKSEKTGKL